MLVLVHLTAWPRINQGGAMASEAKKRMKLRLRILRQFKPRQTPEGALQVCLTRLYYYLLFIIYVYILLFKQRPLLRRKHTVTRPDYIMILDNNTPSRPDY